MDPLSISASIVALGQAGAALSSGVQAVRRFANARVEFAALSNEMTTLQVVVDRVRVMLEEAKTDAATIIPPEDLEPVQVVCDQIANNGRELEGIFAELRKPNLGARQPLKHEENIRRFKWLRFKHKVFKLQNEARSARELLTTCLGTVSVSLGKTATTSILAITSIVEANQDEQREALAGVSQRVDELHDLFMSLQIQPSGRGSSPRRTRATTENDVQHAGHLSRLGNGESEIISFNTTVLQQCDTFCRCHCHNYGSLQLSPWLRSLCGIFWVNYKSLPIRNPSRCIPRCRSRRRGSLRIAYYFPRWLLLAGFTLTLSWDSITDFGASLHLSLPVNVLSFNHDVWDHINDGNLEALRGLMARKAVFPTDMDKEGECLLLYAVAQRQYSVALFLLEQGAKPDQSDLYGRTAAAHAFGQLQRSAHAPNTEHSLRNAVLQRIADFDNMTISPLHTSAGFETMAELESAIRLCSQDIHTYDAAGWTPLHYAARSGLHDPTRLLLSYGVDVHAKTRFEGHTPLMLAAAIGHHDTCKALLDSGARVDDVDNWGYDALTYLDNETISHGHFDTLRLLLASGANPNHKNSRGMTAIHNLLLDNPEDESARPPRLELLRLLIRGGADLNAVAIEDGLTPLLRACAEIKWPDAIKLLVEEGADMTATDADGYTFLHHIASKGHQDLYDWLAAREIIGVDPDAAGIDETTPDDMMKRRETADTSEDGVTDHEFADVTADDSRAFRKLLNGIRQRNQAQGLHFRSRAGGSEEGAPRGSGSKTEDVQEIETHSNIDHTSVGVAAEDLGTGDDVDEFFDAAEFLSSAPAEG